MTPKERRDAVIEFRDMAIELERAARNFESTHANVGIHRDRAAMLRAVASFIERNPEAK